MKAARIEARLSGAALSKRLGKNDNWASQVELGHGSPNPEALVALARELGRTVQWLVTGEESGRSEFLDAMAAYEDRLDPRAKRTVRELAEREASAYVVAGEEFNEIERSMIAAGMPAEGVRQAIQRARETLARSAGAGDEAAQQDRQRAGQ